MNYSARVRYWLLRAEILDGKTYNEPISAADVGNMWAKG